jgi:membrane protein YqaA with SNARE-associated domain
MLRRLYDWTLAKAASKAAPVWLFIVAFVESSFFPIPPDALLLPMCFARRAKSFAFAAICTLGSTAGGVLGYVIGAFAFAAVGAPLIELYGGGAAVEELRLLYQEQGPMVVAFGAFTPFPFKVVTVASGAFGMNLGAFVIACLIARGARFMIEAALIWRFGEPIRAFVEKRLALASFLAFLALAAFVVLVKGLI